MLTIEIQPYYTERSEWFPGSESYGEKPGKIGSRNFLGVGLTTPLWSECSRFLTNCVIYYNACILSELLEYAEREKDFELADRIKRISPVSWKQVNFYGEYTFRDIGDVIDLEQMINQWVALRRDSAKKAN